VATSGHLTLAAHPLDYVQFRVNGSHQAHSADAACTAGSGGESASASSFLARSPASVARRGGCLRCAPAIRLLACGSLTLASAYQADEPDHRRPW